TLFMWGAQEKPEMVLRHFSEIAAKADLPIIVFEYPPASGIGYSPETLAKLTEIPHVCAVKDWSNDIVAFEANLRALRATARPPATHPRQRHGARGDSPRDPCRGPPSHHVAGVDRGDS